MREGLGYRWEGTLLGLVAILLGIPAPVLMWRYGARIRAKSPFCAGEVVQR